MDTFRERINSDFRLAASVSAVGFILILLGGSFVMLLPQLGFAQYGFLIYPFAPIAILTLLWGGIRPRPSNLKCPKCRNQLGTLFAVYRRWWGSVIPYNLRYCPFLFFGL